MKKVLFAATTAKGHINVFHLPYLQLFKDHKWIVHVATNGDEKVVIADKEFIISIKRSPFHLSNLKALQQMIKIMKKERYDLILCHTPMGGVLSRIAAHFSKTSPVIYMAHGFHFYEGAPFLNRIVYESMERLLARWTDTLITINEEDFKASLKFHLKREGKCYKTNGIGVSVEKIQKIKSFPNWDKQRMDRRKELGIEENAIVVLNVAEMIPRKNQETAIKALSMSSNKKLVLLICGRGKLEQKLKELVKELKIETKVIFAGFRKDIPEILNIADIFIFPTFQEGLPVAVMEAMAAGLPVVCSNIRGNKDLIVQKKGGFLCHPKDSTSFQKALQILAENEDLRRKMGEFNKKNISQYDLKAVTNEIQEIYEKTLGYPI